MPSRLIPGWRWSDGWKGRQPVQCFWAGFALRIIKAVRLRPWSWPTIQACVSSAFAPMPIGCAITTVRIGYWCCTGWAACLLGSQSCLWRSLLIDGGRPNAVVLRFWRPSSTMHRSGNGNGAQTKALGCVRIRRCDPRLRTGCGEAAEPKGGCRLRGGLHQRGSQAVNRLPGGSRSARKPGSRRYGRVDDHRQ